VRAELHAAVDLIEPCHGLPDLRARLITTGPGAPIMASHGCPAGHCILVVDDRFLMCGDHWAMVPRPLQQAVYRAYDHGRGLGTAELLAAQTAAVNAVNARLTQGGSSNA
jgi:hypothetical protein